MGWIDHHSGLVIDMNEAQVRTIERVREVLSGTQTQHLTVLASDAGRYGWIEEVLRHILADLQRFSGYRRAQVTQRVSRGVGPQTRVKRDRAPTHALVRCYTAADVALLAEVDCLKRESRDFGSRRDAPPALATVSATGTERQHRETPWLRRTLR
jgi:hypothetical protein